MQYIDPLNIQCKHCKNFRNYSLIELKKTNVCCKFCGESLAYVNFEMEAKQKELVIEMWPGNFIFDGFDAFDLDLELISESEFDNIKNISDLIEVITSNIDSDKNVEDYFVSLNILEPLLKCNNYKDVFLMDLSEVARFTCTNE